MLHVVCYVIDCDVQCNEEKVRPIHTNSIQFNRGYISRHFKPCCAHQNETNVSAFVCCVYCFQIAKHLLACMCSIFKFIIAWCMIVSPFLKCRKLCTHIPFYGYLMSPFLYLGCSFALSLHIRCFHCDERERKMKIEKKEEKFTAAYMNANRKEFSLQPHVCRICVCAGLS